MPEQRRLDQLDILHNFGTTIALKLLLAYPRDLPTDAYPAL